MNLGRIIYRSLLQITKQYELKRLPLTGVVGFTEARFSSPPTSIFRDGFRVRQIQPDFDAGFRAIKQLQAQQSVLENAGPVEQVAYAIWHQLLSEGNSRAALSPMYATDTCTWGSFAAAKMLRHPHPGHTCSRGRT